MKFSIDYNFLSSLKITFTVFFFAITKRICVHCIKTEKCRIAQKELQLYMID